MLLSLHIENVATIKSLDIDFESGFNILTGETGAGKSILIDSIGLLLGDRFDKSLIRTGEEEASVSGLFGNLSADALAQLLDMGVKADEEGSIFIARQITAEGKSRARINGAGVSISLLRSVGEKIMNILGQSEHQLLSDEKAYMAYLDRYAETEELIDEYKAVYGEYAALDTQIKALQMDEGEKMRMLDMYRYQLKEIEVLGLTPGEEEKLLEDEKRFKNAERIDKNARFAYMALKGSERGSASYILERTIASIEKIGDVVPEAGKMTAELRDCVYKIEDVAVQMHDLLDYFGEENPESVLDKLETRLASIEKMKKKYGKTVEEILLYGGELKAKITALSDTDGEIELLQKKKKTIEKQLEEKANLLHEKRVKMAAELSQKVVENLRFMDLEGVRFLVSVERVAGKNPYTANGADTEDF